MLRKFGTTESTQVSVIPVCWGFFMINEDEDDMISEGFPKYSLGSLYPSLISKMFSGCAFLLLLPSFPGSLSVQNEPAPCPAPLNKRGDTPGHPKVLAATSARVPVAGRAPRPCIPACNPERDEPPDV